MSAPHLTKKNLHFPLFNINKIVQHNFKTTGGTSGSFIFDHQGYIIAIHNAGTETVTINTQTGEETRVATGSLGFGIRVDEAWGFIQYITNISSKPVISPKSKTLRMPNLSIGYSRPYEFDAYLPFPLGWNGRTIQP